jgi:hypothetical protein
MIIRRPAADAMATPFTVDLVRPKATTAHSRHNMPIPSGKNKDQQDRQPQVSGEEIEQPNGRRPGQQDEYESRQHGMGPGHPGQDCDQDSEAGELPLIRGQGSVRQQALRDPDVVLPIGANQWQPPLQDGRESHHPGGEENCRQYRQIPRHHAGIARLGRQGEPRAQAIQSVERMVHGLDSSPMPDFGHL